MANSTITSGNVVTKFLNEFAHEYVRKSRFSPYTGTSTNNVIQIKEGRKTVSLPLIAKLDSDGVTGSGTLTGNEETLNNFDKVLVPTYIRNGVLIDNEEREKSEFDLFMEARPALMNWAKERQRDDIIEALNAIDNGTTYANYGDATAAAMDTWNTNNTDRILYGELTANLTAGDHTTSLATIDTTNDKLDAGMISLAKRLAKNADPLIHPIKLTEDEDWFVFFVDSFGMRDLRADTDISAANRDARIRGMDNPIFTGGDLIWDGVIIREIEEISRNIDGASSNGIWGVNATADGLDNAGDSSSRVGVGFLCGTQGVGYGLGQMPQFNLRKEDDYGHQNGVGIALKHDIDKVFFNTKQHGIVTVFYSAATDA